ncbi:MAG: sel1 repeat family protein [Ectothiorhodospiraceae bacterium]|nr:sel1 repeat family protein [Ectothiorhodospiraceae bacterium]
MSRLVSEKRYYAGECVLKREMLTLGAKIILLFVCIVHSAAAYEGDYIWEERFKAALIKSHSGLANDQYSVGTLYFLGRGTEIDHVKALHWFSLAGDQGHRKAAYKAGYLHLRGEALAHSSWTALQWFRQSAQAGYAPAQYELGRLFMSGSLGKRDNARALMWMGKARAAHFAPAEEAFEQIVNQIIKIEGEIASGSAEPH